MDGNLSPGTGGSNGIGRAITEALARAGTLVNDAASHPGGTLRDMPAGAGQRVPDVNVTGTVMVTRAPARHRVRRRAAGAPVVPITTGPARG